MPVPVVLMLSAALIVAIAAPARPARAEIGVQGPVGWQSMCRETPAYCNRSVPAGNGVTGPDLTRAEMDLLRQVNRHVNRSIRAAVRAPTLDPWRIAPAEGHCTDYALTKKHLLQAQGWPPAHLRFASVLTEAGEPHAILLVATAAGPLVLDNRTDRVRPWSDVAARGYVLLAVEGEGPGGIWRATPAAALLALAMSPRQGRSGS